MHGLRKSEGILRQKVIDTIERYGMIDKGDGIVLGLSGGPDSICLLHTLNSILKLYDMRIYAVHINHLIRDDEALRDEEYSREFCKSLGIPFYSKRVPVEEYANHNKISTEEAGRHVRYNFFEEVSAETGSRRIALAHNMNDQTETMLMHFIRGSGISGIAGIKPVRQGKYIRPLIACGRDEIEEYCRVNNLNPVIDSTNRENIYSRNRIRLELIPYIKEHFNPNIIESLYKVSELIRDEDDYLNSKAFLELEKINNNGEVSLTAFNLLHVSIRRRILRILIEGIKGNLTGIESKHIDDCLELLKRGVTGKSINLPDEIICTIIYDRFLVKKVTEIKDFEYDIPIPGNIKLDDVNIELQTRCFETGTINLRESNFKKYFDYDKIKAGLRIRNRRDGDYMYPAGMEGKKKLKDIFIDKKIPRDERARIPIVACGSEVLWIPGIRDGRNYRVDEKTKKVLEISLLRGNENE